MAHIERGGIRAIVEEIDTKVNNILLGGAFYDISSAESAITDESVDWGVRLYAEGGEPVAEVDITQPGSWKVYRIRAGVTTQITAGAVPSTAIGRVYCLYDFPTADWDIGDVFYFVFSNIQYLEGAITKSVPTRIIWGRIVLEHSVEQVHTAVLDVDADLVLVKDSIATLQGTANAIKTQTDKLQFSGTNDVKATLDNEQVFLAEGAISASKIMSNAIDSGKVADGFITANKIASNSITSTKVADGFITANKIANDSITSSKLAANAIVASRIADGALDAPKFSTAAVTKIQGGLPQLRQIPGQNLLRDIDGSCESATGWGSWGAAIPEFSTEQIYGGTGSVKLTQLASGNGMSTSTGGPLVQGVTYRVRAKVYNVSAGSTLTVGIYDGRFEEHPSTWSRTQLAAYGVWTTVDMLFTPLTAYASAALVFRMSGGSGTWYLDEVSLTHADPVDMPVPATPRAGSLLDILHKDTNGTYSRATDSLEAIRDRIEEFLGSGWNAATASMIQTALYAGMAGWLVRNAHIHMSVQKLQWTLSGTPGYLTAPTDGSAYASLSGGIPAYSGVVRLPIEPGIVTISTGTITGTGTFACIAQAQDDAGTWRNVSGWTSGVASLASNNVYQITPPRVIIDGVYIQGLRYSLTAVGSPTISGSLRISAAFTHRVEIS